MAHRIRSHRIGWSSLLAGLTLAMGMVFRPVAGADLPGCRDGNCPNCPVNSKYFGYYPTLWRRWPGTEPQPQQVAPPAVEGVGVPPVEPPPASEEIENKSKTNPPESSGGGGPATTNPPPDAANKPSLPPPDEDPNAKKPNAQSGKGAAPVAPDAPQKLNQTPPNRGIDAMPAFFELNREPRRSAARSPEPWPPTNVLRSDEIRASLQLPDGVTIPKVNAIPSTIPAASAAGSSFPTHSEGSAPQQNTTRWPTRQTDATPSPSLPPNVNLPHEAPMATAQPSPPVDWTLRQNRSIESWHPDVGPSAAGSSSFPDGAHFSKTMPAPVPNAGQALHWMEPAQPKSPGCDPSLSDRSAFVAPDASHAVLGNSAHARAALPAETALKPGADNFNGAARRIPFIPSASLNNPVASLDPRALTEASASPQFVPVDASTNRLAPPSKVNEISVPMIPAPTAEPRRLARTAIQDNVLQIDPLAIQKSLEAAKPLAETASIVEDRRRRPPSAAFSEQTGTASLSPSDFPVESKSSPRNTSAKEVFQFADGIAPQRKELEPYQSGRATVGKSDLKFADKAMPERLTSVDPLNANRLPPASAVPANPWTPRPLVKPQGASVIVSDDNGSPDGVQQAAYIAPAGPSPLPAGRDNPLRVAAPPSREVLSTDASQLAWPEPQAGAGRSASGWSNPLR
ncbi:MAG TPA: hypothetical protein VGY55_17630 [Pirellulales bacterium]|jgi:hypothetical protein|nr:hypothetical protein [Pirellulales bacterium]